MYEDLPEKIDTVIKLMDQAERKLALVKAMIKQLNIWKQEGVDLSWLNLKAVLENAESVHKQYCLSTDCLRVIYEDIKRGEGE